MNKGERLEKLIKESHYKNVNQVSKVTGVPYTTIKSFIERDLEKASIDAVVKIAKVLGVTVEELIGESSPIIEGPKRSRTLFPTAISAGLPLEVDGVTESSTITVSDEILGRYKNDRDIFFVRANGDSMNKLFDDGSLLAIKPTPLESLKNGDIVVYSLNGEYGVKQYFLQDSTLIFKPLSTNNAHFDQVYKLSDNVSIHGKVVTYIVNVD